MIRAFLFAAILAAPITTAHAGKHCGGGGESAPQTTDHRSTTSREVSYTDSSPHTTVESTPATGCIDDTDVVGYRKCSKFGEWGGNLRIPRMFIELGTNVRQFSSMVGNQTGEVTHGDEGFSYRMVMPEAASASVDTAMTSVLRVGTGFRNGLYAAAEGELGGMSAPRGASVEMTSGGTFGTPNLDPSTGLYVAAAGVAGIRNTSRRGVIGLEGAGGVRSARYRFASSYHFCEETSTIAITRGIVEARARAEIFLGPWVTLGGTLGTSVISRNDWLAGVYIGMHSRAFGGGR